MPDAPPDRVPAPGPSTTPAAVSVIVAGPGRWPRIAVIHDGLRVVADLAEARTLVGDLDAQERPRWTWWSAHRDVAALIAPGGPALTRCHDLAEVHRVLHGGWLADPGTIWATVHGLDHAGAPRPPADDLFDLLVEDLSDDGLTTAAGYLRADAVTGRWQQTDERLLAWADAATRCASAQLRALTALGPRALASGYAESAAALLCVELERDGLPIDRDTAEALITAAAGPRPRDAAHAAALRADRDARVLGHLPHGAGYDLRNPDQVRSLLASTGLTVPNTRKWTLEPLREAHPVVGALLDHRRDERIATTYGWGWLDAHVGADDRLRGGWTACDGAAGRMTAQNGLHNLPASLRPAVAAGPGRVLVRADLGQVEPRVLAAVTGDAAFAQATRADDLYAPVAAQLGVTREVAKIAVLAAMYGQRSGPAGEALKRLERAYPVAMGLLDRTYEAGVRGEPIRTHGGRLIRTDSPPADRVSLETAEPTTHRADEGTLTAEQHRGRDAARGRFARNAIIQGSAAELFKAWAATVRIALRDKDSRIVLCLHDELLVEAPAPRAAEVRDVLEESLTDAARRWQGGDGVRFVADIAVVRSWSEAKGQAPGPHGPPTPDHP